MSRSVSFSLVPTANLLVPPASFLTRSTVVQLRLLTWLQFCSSFHLFPTQEPAQSPQAPDQVLWFLCSDSAPIRRSEREGLYTSLRGLRTIHCGYPSDHLQACALIQCGIKACSTSFLFGTRVLHLQCLFWHFHFADYSL